MTLLRTLRWRVLFLCIAHTFANLGIAYGTHHQIGSVGKSPAWDLMRTSKIPEDMWPFAFMCVALLSAFGTTNLTIARLGFYLGAALMGGWSVALFWVWYLDGAQPGAFLLAYVAMLKWAVAEFILIQENTAATLDNMASDAAQSVLEHSNDGPTD